MNVTRRTCSAATKLFWNLLLGKKEKKIRALLNLVMVVRNLSKVTSRGRANEKTKLKENLGKGCSVPADLYLKHYKII